MTGRQGARPWRKWVRYAALATTALAAIDLAANVASAQTRASSGGALPGVIGRWAGAGIQVDWLGAPLEIPRIEVNFDSANHGTINYPTLGCAGELTRIGASETFIEYRETLTSGADKCPSGAFVSLRAAGDRWVYNWSVQSDWLRRDALSSQALPSQPGAGPDGDWVRSGVLSSDPRPIGAPAPRAPAASVDQRISRIENFMVPPVLVQGEAVQKASLADRMAALRVPGVSIAVIHNGRIDWARSYGISRPGGAPVTPETLFQAASISKPVTALVTMRLAQDKAVDLDVDVDTYLKGWKVPRDSDAQDRLVTLRALLTHTAGVSVHGFAGYAPDQPIPTLDQILKGEKPANSAPFRIDTDPGALWRYSGGGYVIIRRVLEDVTGQPFGELARRIVLAPAAMDHSTFAQPLPDELKKDAAWPYGADGQPLKEGAHTYPEITPDGLWTTPTDLARLALEVQHSLKGGSNAVLAPSTTHEMLQPGGLADWGMGWGLGGTAEHRYFWHSGSNAGFKSMLFAYGDGEGAVVMTNSDAGEKLAAEVVRTIAYEYGWPDYRPFEISPVPVSAEQLDRLVGQYKIGRYATLTVTRQGDRLFAQTPDRPSFRLYPRSNTAWFAIDPDGFSPNPNIQLSFNANARGAITEVAVRDGWVDKVAPRLDKAQADRFAATVAARVSAKTASDGAERALRGYIEGLEAGRPDYETLGPGAAYITRLMLLNFASEITGLGQIQSLEFKGVAPNGADLFAVKFANGAAVAQILIGEDGRIELVYVSSPLFM